MVLSPLALASLASMALLASVALLASLASVSLLASLASPLVVVTRRRRSQRADANKRSRRSSVGCPFHLRLNRIRALRGLERATLERLNPAGAAPVRAVARLDDRIHRAHGAAAASG